MVSAVLGHVELVESTWPESAPPTAADAAQALYTLGLNVFPQPLGKKEGSVWRFMQRTRLRQEDLAEVFAGQCNIAVMVGRTSGNLFVLDFETDAGFQNALFELRARAIPLWAVVTARGGHIYLRSAEGPVKSIATGRIPGMEVRGQGGYVLAPPSLHPTGARYMWLLQEGDAPPIVRAADIDFLSDADDLPVALQSTRRRVQEARPRLTNTTREYLENGHLMPEGSRHNAFFSACCNYRDAGYGRTEMERDLVPIAHASGLPDPTDPHELTRAMDWAMNNVRPKDYSGATFGRALPDPDAFDWPGRTARTDRAVFAALVERARLGSNNAGIFRGAQRELMALASIADYHTLGRALKRLGNRGLIAHAGFDKASGAALWHWGDATKQVMRAAANAPHFDAANGKTNANHSTGKPTSEDSSAVIYGLCSPAERRVLVVLESAGTPLKPSTIAPLAGLEVRQVKHTLRAGGVLRRTGTVTRVAGGWSIGVPDNAIAKHMKGQADKRQQEIRQRGADDRARDAAQRIIRWRFRYDRANFWPG